jgi:diguanylate cyclase (GGDEF)-like protein
MSAQHTSGASPQKQGGETGNGVDDLVRLSFFADIGKAITSAFTVRETVSAVMEQIGKIFAPTYWTLFLRNHATGELRFAKVVGSGVEELEGRVLPRGSGVAGWIAESGEALIIEDVSRDKRFNPEMDRLTGFTTRSIIGVPLRSRGKIFGVIELINKINGQNFTPFELNLLQTIADYAAIAIEKQYYFRAVKRMASVDSLTGLYNRRVLMRHLEKEVEKTKRDGTPFALVLADVDHFKKINDRHGHGVGDKVLERIAGILREHTRKADILCRLGGDEFVVVLREARRLHAEKLKERIEEALQEHNRSAAVPVSLSYGIYEGTPQNADEALNFVDRNMYREKEEKQERQVLSLEKHTDELMQE